MWFGGLEVSIVIYHLQNRNNPYVFTLGLQVPRIIFASNPVQICRLRIREKIF
jgi:hypothetical protein